MCPSTQLIKLLIELRENHERGKNKSSYLSLDEKILEKFYEYGLVCIITKDEDMRLKGKLRTDLSFSSSGAFCSSAFLNFFTASTCFGLFSSKYLKKLRRSINIIVPKPCTIFMKKGGFYPSFNQAATASRTVDFTYSRTFSGVVSP